MTLPVLTTRQLNRATLTRQMLLSRQEAPIGAVIEHLVGMQAQNPLDPYYALHSRLEGFDPAELATMITSREAVRGLFMRGTLHLVTTVDYFGIHPVTADVLRRVFNSTSFAKDCAGLDLGQLVEHGRALLESGPMTRVEIVRAVQPRYPDRVGPSLGQAITYLSPLVQVPPRGVWGKTRSAAWTYAPSYLGRPYGGGNSVADLVLRYLAAFGPAAVKDMRA